MYPRASLIAGAACCALSTALVHAAEPPPSETGRDPAPVAIEDVLVVSASREPVPREHVAGALTVFGPETLERSREPFVSALLRTAPAASVSRSGGPGAQTQLRSRGTEANHTLVLIDGVEANDVAFGSEFDFAHLTTVGVARVEFLRGPQSALWGSDALGGVVSVTTPRGEGPPSVGVSAEGGAHGTRATSLSAGAGGERADAFVAIGRRVIDGTNRARRGEEDDGYENTSAALRLGWRGRGGLAASLTGRWVDATAEFDPAPPPAFRPVDGDRETDTEQLLLAARLGWASPDGRLRSRISAELADADNVTRADGVETNQAAGRRTQLSWQGSVEMPTRLGPEARHRLTLVAERERVEFHQRAAASVFGDPDQDQELVHNAAVLEYRGRFAERVTLAASVRRDANEAFDDAASWRSAVLWSLPEHGTRLHASVGRAVKNPTFTERFGFTPDTFIGNPALEPERSLGWEAGVEQRLAAERVVVGARYFASTLDDEIEGFVFDPALGGFTARNRRGESDRRGVELLARAAPLPWASLDASATWLDASEPDGAGESDELRRAEWRASLAGTLVFAGGRGDAWIGASWTGARTDRDFATFPATRVTLDDYLRLDAAVSWRVRDALELWLRGENLTGADYEEVFGFATPGAAAYVGLRWTLAHGG